jgi:hypothetical protein
MTVHGTGNLSIKHRTGVRCRGVTLAELTVSMTIAALLMGGMTSALLIANQAVETGNSPTAQAAEARLVADLISADLSHAIAIEEQSNRSITVVVPDRDADNSAELIRYSWSGVAGEPLLREYNGGPVSVSTERVYDLSFTYRAGPLSATPLEESVEFELFSYDPYSGGSFKDYGVDHNSWCAQYFKPTLPVNAVSWGITYAYVALKLDSYGRILAVGFRTADERLKPTSQVLEEVTVKTDLLPVYYSWSGFEFSITGLDPATGACLVVKQLSDSTGAKLQYYENGFSMPQNTHWMTTSDEGVSWSVPVNNRDMLFYVYGKVTTRGPARW